MLARRRREEHARVDVVGAERKGSRELMWPACRSLDEMVRRHYTLMGWRRQAEARDVCFWTRRSLALVLRTRGHGRCNGAARWMMFASVGNGRLNEREEAERADPVGDQAPIVGVRGKRSCGEPTPVWVTPKMNRGERAVARRDVEKEEQCTRMGILPAAKRQK